MRGRVLFTYLCLRIVVSNKYCVVFLFILCLVCHALPVSLNCPFLIALSVFSEVYLGIICILKGLFNCN